MSVYQEAEIKSLADIGNKVSYNGMPLTRTLEPTFEINVKLEPKARPSA